MLWTLARDDATPASGWLRHVSARWRNPLHAQIICGCCVTALGCIYIASDRAFNAFVGTFAILTTLSYLSAILPHLLTARKYVRPGPVSLLSFQPPYLKESNTNPSTSSTSPPPTALSSSPSRARTSSSSTSSTCSRIQCLSAKPP
jgi:hypothetical protein